MCLQKIEMFIRKSIAEEQEAITNYLERQHKLTDMQDDLSEEEYSKIETFKEVLSDIISEEEIHVGQLKQLLTVFEISDENENKGKEETLDTYTDVLNKLNRLIEE